MSFKNPTLNLSESFYSIQGEGATAGVPAYFLRLQNCNLICGGPDGRLMKDGKASWYCDTEKVWRKGVETSYDKILNDMHEVGQLERIVDGLTHIVWTGGEPALPNNQTDMMRFMQKLNSQYEKNNAYQEIETNGTLRLNRYVWGELDQINCSPKLSNSGMTESSRINRDAINQIKGHKNPWFKFVVSSEDDIREVEDSYILPSYIPSKQVILMPGLDRQEDVAERTKFVMEMSKKYGYRCSSRLHVLAWDKTTGV